MTIVKPSTEKPSAPLQISTKDNLPSGKPHVKSPRKSILKSTIRESIPISLQARSPSPRRRISLQDREDGTDPGYLPDLEKESPVPTIRRKSKSPERPKPTNNIIRSVSPLPKSPKKQDVDGDLWTTVTQPVQPALMKKVELPPKKQKDEPPVELSEGLGSAVLEIQTVLRRDIERLRLDMVRQFVSFRNEMGQKWEGEVDRLRSENELLRGELSTLKKEQEKKKDEKGSWKFTLN